LTAQRRAGYSAPSWLLSAELDIQNCQHIYYHMYLSLQMSQFEVVLVVNSIYTLGNQSWHFSQNLVNCLHLITQFTYDLTQSYSIKEMVA